jgi:hypothetical protein
MDIGENAASKVPKRSFFRRMPLMIDGGLPQQWNGGFSRLYTLRNAVYSRVAHMRAGNRTAWAQQDSVVLSGFLTASVACLTDSSSIRRGLTMDKRTIISLQLEG